MPDMIPPVDFTNVPEQTFDPKPPGDYRLRIASVDYDETQNVLTVESDVLDAVTLLDGAPKPTTFGKVWDRFFNFVASPSASQEDKEAARRTQGRFKRFWRVVTGQELTGVKASYTSLVGQEYVGSIRWSLREKGPGGRRVRVTYSEYLQRKLNADDIFENVTNYKPLTVASPNPTTAD